MISLIRAAFPASFILLALITLILFYEARTFRCCSLFSFLQPPVAPRLVRPNVLLNTPYSYNRVLSFCDFILVRYECGICGI